MPILGIGTVQFCFSLRPCLLILFKHILFEVDKQNRNNYEGVEKDFKLAYNLLVSFGIGGLKERRAAAPRCCKSLQQRYP